MGASKGVQRVGLRERLESGSLVGAFIAIVVALAVYVAPAYNRALFHYNGVSSVGMPPQVVLEGFLSSLTFSLLVAIIFLLTAATMLLFATVSVNLRLRSLGRD